MTAGEACSREVVVMSRDESVAAAARLMLQHHVGTVVVIDKADGRNRPVGIITDRDIAVGVVALGLDAEATPVGSVIHGTLASVREDEDISCVAELMRARGLRRTPVVNASGALVGILSADDLLELFTEEMGALASVAARGANRERELRPSGPKL